MAKTTVTKYCGDVCAKRAYKDRKRKEKIDSSVQQTATQVQLPVLELQAKEFLSIQETCQLLGISRTTLWRTIKKGRLKTASTGGRVIIRKRDLESLFNQ